MKSKIRYARVVVPDKEHEYVSKNGHLDHFVTSMDVDVIIRVKRRQERGWYVSLNDKTGWNYHCSWLKFVKKPKGKKS